MYFEDILYLNNCVLIKMHSGENVILQCGEDLKLALAADETAGCDYGPI